MDREYDQYSREDIFFDYVLTEQDLDNIRKDIAAFCRSQVGMSYDDLKTYIYDNDKHAWLFALRKEKIRRFITLILSDSRKHHKVKYNHDRVESLELLVEAEKRYFERNGRDEEIMERRVEEMTEKGSPQ